MPNKYKKIHLNNFYNEIAKLYLILSKNGENVNIK